MIYLKRKFNYPVIMNYKIYIFISFIFLSCESKETSLLLSGDSEKQKIADTIYELTLSTTSGIELNQVEIKWNFTIFETIQIVRIGYSDDLKVIDGFEEYDDTNEDGEYSEGEPFTDTNGDNVWGWKYIDSITYSGMEAGEFRDYEFILTLSESIYVDTIQIYTKPLNTISNFNFNFETVMVGSGQYEEGETFTDLPNGVYDYGEIFTDLGNGVWDEGEIFTDINDDGIWNEEEDFIDLGNGVWDEGEPYTDTIGNLVWDEGELYDDLPDTEQYNRILQWTNPSISSIETIKIFRSPNALNLLELNNCNCKIASIEPNINYFIDTEKNVEPGVYFYFYRIQVENSNAKRASLITNNYTQPPSPEKIYLSGEHVTGSDSNPNSAKNNYINISWDRVVDPTLTYFYQYEIWRYSENNSSTIDKVVQIIHSEITSFQDRNVDTGAIWWYTVAIKNVSGELVHSNFVQGSSK